MGKHLSIVLIAMFFSLGCNGGGDTETGGTSNPQSSTMPLPPPPQASAPRAVAPPVRPAVDPNKTAANPKEDEQKELTSNDYLYTTEPQRYEIATVEEVALAHQFSVVTPKSSSQQLVVNAPEPESGRSRQNISQLKLPKGFDWFPDSGLSSTGFPWRITCTMDGSEMVLMESGTFTQGTNRQDSNATPELSVYVSAFYIDTTEVTVGQYKKYQAVTSGAAAPLLPADVPPQQLEHYPATGLPHADAVNYAKWVGKSLPTESEWERAARGTKGNLYPWGNGKPPIVDGGLKDILPVRSRPTDVTQTGLFDMASNAREWVSDWYSAAAYQDLVGKTGTLARDPQGPKRADNAGDRVVRGSHEEWELWIRDHAHLKRSAPDVGFRCVLRITSEMQPSEKPAAVISSPAIQPGTIPRSSPTR